MDADYYLETIKVVFQEFALVNGTWDVKNEDGLPERVRPEDIRTTAHFTVEGERDDISGSGQTEAAHALCVNVPKDRQKHLEVKGAGHYGIFSGRRWRDIVYPQVREFIVKHHMTHSPAAKVLAKPVAKAAVKAIAKPAPKAAAKPAKTPAVKPALAKAVRSKATAAG